MTNKTQTIVAWIVAFVLMSGLAIYQRTTGPTYPKSGTTTVGGVDVKYSIIRTFGGPGDADVRITIPDKNIRGEMIFKRYKSYDEWTIQEMKVEGNELVGYLPHLPPAGKMIFEIFLEKDKERVMVTKEPVILRFKGSVPDFILIPHIIFMFTAMVFSLRAAISGLYKWDTTFSYSKYTLILFAIGGLMFGPMVQYYAFGFLWTGWPLADGSFNLLKFGDLTDNKTLMGIATWVIAYIQMRRNPNAKYWAVIAAVVLIAVYLIPHSAMGSEIDFRELENIPQPKL
ncbi:MAG TPA: hypothetical protein PLE30_00095 [Candidatus Kapabacteria bacterium]|nr:hypothetical protein [Candidatus Kapabacteria bacterium]